MHILVTIGRMLTATDLVALAGTCTRIRSALMLGTYTAPLYYALENLQESALVRRFHERYARIDGGGCVYDCTGETNVGFSGPMILGNSLYYGHLQRKKLIKYETALIKIADQLSAYNMQAALLLVAESGLLDNNTLILIQARHLLRLSIRSLIVPLFEFPPMLEQLELVEVETTLPIVFANLPMTLRRMRLKDMDVVFRGAGCLVNLTHLSVAFRIMQRDECIPEYPPNLEYLELGSVLLSRHCPVVPRSVTHVKLTDVVFEAPFVCHPIQTLHLVHNTMYILFTESCLKLIEQCDTLRLGGLSEIGTRCKFPHLRRLVLDNHVLSLDYLATPKLESLRTTYRIDRHTLRAFEQKHPGTKIHTV